MKLPISLLVLSFLITTSSAFGFGWLRKLEPGQTYIEVKRAYSVESASSGVMTQLSQYCTGGAVENANAKYSDCKMNVKWPAGVKLPKNLSGYDTNSNIFFEVTVIKTNEKYTCGFVVEGDRQIFSSADHEDCAANRESCYGGSYTVIPHKDFCALTCTPKPTPETKCTSGVFHPVTKRCVSEEITSHKNGYFFTKDAVCVPSMNGARTHCTDMKPAWNGCTKESDLEAIDFKVPDPLSRCALAVNGGGPVNTVQFDNNQQVNRQTTAFNEAQVAYCKCQNDALDSALGKIVSHPVDDESGNVSDAFDSYLKVAKECKKQADEVPRPNLACVAINGEQVQGCEGVPYGDDNKTPADSSSSTSSSQIMPGGNTSGISTEQSPKTAQQEAPALSNAGSSNSTGFSSGQSNSLSPYASIAAPHEFYANDMGSENNVWGGGGSSGASRAPASGTSASSNGNYFGGSSTATPVSEKIQTAKAQKGITDDTIFGIVHLQYHKLTPSMTSAK